MTILRDVPPTGTFDSFTMHIPGESRVLIVIGAFRSGVILLEQRVVQTWVPLNMTKVGRGMITNATAEGPAQFSGVIYGPVDIRVRAQDTAEMQPIVVEIRCDGVIARHSVRGASKFVIEEDPDVRDLIQ